jgi:glycosyltransferase involved in cell wall biosynthesis
LVTNIASETSLDAPLVSVMMTSYNREKYIAAAIESVIASTYTNFELIIVDDRSKDATVAIATSYATNDSRVKVYVNEINLGDYPNRNKAASYATGKYLKYVDADDLIYPWGLELLVRMMEQFPASGWGLCSLPQVVKSPYPFMLTPKEAYTYNYLESGIFHKAPLSAIIKRAVFEEIGGFADIRMAGDFEMWHKLAQKYNVVLMPDGIVWYRKHGEQEIKHYRQFITVYEKIRIDYLLNDNCPIDKDVAKKILRATKRKFVIEALKGVLKINKNIIMDNLECLREYKNV